MFKLYGNSKINNWEEITTSMRLEQVERRAEKLTGKEYYSYMIKESSKEGDRIVKQENLYEECMVEYSNDVKVDFEVKAAVFKPGRMKNKEELRRLTDEYVDR